MNASLAEERSPEDNAYLKLLASLKEVKPSESEGAIVTRIARFTASPTVLDAIAAVPKWYTRWETREALVQNPRAPELMRSVLGTSLAVIDLMREMAAPGLAESEREEIKDDIRSLIQTLPPLDRDTVRERARTLAANARAPVPSDVDLGGLVQRIVDDDQKTAMGEARSASGEQLLTALRDDREKVRQAALESPHLDEAILLLAIAESKDGDLLSDLASRPRWSFNAAVRNAVRAHAAAPLEVKAKFEATNGLLLSLARYFNEPLERKEKAAIGKGILGEIHELTPLEREFVKQRMGASWTEFIRDVTSYIEDDVRGIRPVPVGSGTSGVFRRLPDPVTTTEFPHGAQPAAAPTHAVIETFDEVRHAPAPLHQQPVAAEVRKDLSHAPYEDRARIAATTANRDEMAFLLHDRDDRVFAALLQNPHLPKDEVVGVARNAQRERIEKIEQNRPLYALLGIKAALLHNPHCPEPIQLDCLNHLTSMRELALVMRDPKVRSLEVKAKARARMKERYQVMSPPERAAAVKQTGGDILNDLWTDAFSDERTLMHLLDDRALDEGIVLRIVRSRIAPRGVLAAIGRDPSFTNNPQIRIELVLNPKTPREVVQKLIAKLSPGERKRLKDAGGIAESVRGMV